MKSGTWPTEWDAATGKGIVYKAPVPSPGNSSPIIWGNRIFLTGATTDAQDVMCFERSSGKLLWRTPVSAPRPGFTADDIQVQDPTGYASPTAATDGERVYVTFASSDVAALDFDGHVVWALNLGKPDSMYGRSTSLLVYDGKLIVQFDRGMEPEDGLSALMALDVKTGATVWSTPRPVEASWATPIIINTGKREELVANGSPWIMAYDPKDGHELWRCSGMRFDVACSPTFANGLVYITNENAEILAIRPGGTGDVTKANVVWTGDDGMSDAASPIVDEHYFLQVNSSGRVSCYDALKGGEVWDDLLPCALWASPTLADGRAYLPGDNGKVYVLKMGDSTICCRRATSASRCSPRRPSATAASTSAARTTSSASARRRRRSDDRARYHRGGGRGGRRLLHRGEGRPREPADHPAAAGRAGALRLPAARRARAALRGGGRDAGAGRGRGQLYSQFRRLPVGRHSSASATAPPATWPARRGSPTRCTAT